MLVLYSFISPLFYVFGLFLIVRLAGGPFYLLGVYKAPKVILNDSRRTV
jgi:hypothetical protein